MAPASTYGDQALIVILPEPTRVITGGTISSTLTVRVAVIILRFESVTEYVRIYVPYDPVLTVPLIVTGITPSSISNPDAHNSVYDVPNGTIIVDAPVSVTVGILHVITLTVRVAVVVLKLESVAE